MSKNELFDDISDAELLEELDWRGLADDISSYGAENLIGELESRGYKIGDGDCCLLGADCMSLLFDYFRGKDCPQAIRDEIENATGRILL